MTEVDRVSERLGVLEAKTAMQQEALRRLHTEILAIDGKLSLLREHMVDIGEIKGMLAGDGDNTGLIKQVGILVTAAERKRTVLRLFTWIGSVCAAVIAALSYLISIVDHLGKR